jgi:serine/threonine-protein kinase
MTKKCQPFLINGGGYFLYFSSLNRDLTDLDIGSNQKRNRLIALSFASVLLLLVYGPLAPWFLTADRFLYDTFASGLPNRPLDNAIIISIDPSRASHDKLLADYGQVLSVLSRSQARRIILPQPPELGADERLPGWSAALGGPVAVYVPNSHRLAELTTHTGFMEFVPDDDGVLRRTNLWQLNGAIMSPSLPLAVALDNENAPPSKRMSASDDTVYLSNYEDLPRVAVDEILFGDFASTRLNDATIFVDHEPALVGASAVLPSGQFVTRSELTAALIADIEADRSVVVPAWVSALQWLAPVLLAIVAVLFLPERGRRNILVISIATVVALLLLEMLLLYVLRVRLDIGRAALIFIGVGLLSLWLVGNPRKATQDAFRRGSDFLAAGRLEPAFAEFRRCSPSDTLATVMYKLSIAFEEQAKPERAEAVIEWMKRTQGARELKQKKNAGVAGVPKRLGRYVIERRIGRGAMGAVYLAKDPRINRAVAVKAIPIDKEFEDDELKEARIRFFREAESAGRLTHPNIITVFDAGEDKGLAYIAMEYVPGIPLRDFTDPKRLLAPRRALELAASTAEALDYAHNQGVIHRDIKPANLLYNPKEGSLKISDFGVARITDNNRTKTGIVLGTPMYMSPEQLGAENLTGHSDLFSLGVTLYELLIGEVPFKAGNIAALMAKITTEDPSPIAGKRAGLAPSIDAVLAKALAKRPEDRFSCGAEMAIALRNCARYS